MRETTKILALLACMGAAVLAPGAARAQATEDPAEAEGANAEEETPEMQEAMERFEGAQALFDRGDYRAALAEFQRIYDLLEGHPRRYFVLFNLGRSYEELHRYDRAIELYQRYLDEGGDQAEDRADVEASLRALERLLGTVAIRVTGPDTAEVWIGEWQVGEAPGEIRIPGGQHTIEVRAQGFEVARQTIEVASRQRIEVDVALSRLSDFRGVTPALFISSAVATAVAAGVAIGFGVQAMQLGDQASACATTPRCTLDVPARRQEIRDAALIADVMWGVTGLFAVTSLVLVFVTDWGQAEVQTDDRAPQTALRVLPWGGPESAGLALSGAF